VRTLVRTFRQDKPLAIAMFVMACVCLAPLAATSILPLIDLPHHVALSGLLWDVAFGRGVASQYYEINLSPSPYWTTYLMLAVSMRTFGVYLGTKIVVAICMMSVPLGVMRLLVALGKSPRMGLLALLMMWDINLIYGWLNQILGTGVAFFALAELIEANTPRKAMRVWPWGIFLAFTHVLPFGFFGLCALLLTIVRPGSRWMAIKIFISAISAQCLALLPWLVHSFQSGSGGDPGFAFDPLPVKVERLLDFSLGFFHVDPNANRAALAVVCVVVATPLTLAFFPKKLNHRPLRVAAVPFLVALFLYVVLPINVHRPIEHWGAYIRFCTPALLGLLLLPSPRLGNRHWWIAGIGGLAGAVLSGYLFIQFRAFDREIEPFYQVAKKVPMGAKLLPLCYQNKYPMIRLPLGESLHGYIVAESGTYNPYLFGQSSLPVQKIPGRVPPAPPAWGRNARYFSMWQYGQFYDYILVQGTSYDPVRVDRNHKKTVKLVFASGPYRLYSVR
jgi:hypothetical protein